MGALLLLALNSTGLAELTLSDLNTSCALRPGRPKKSAVLAVPQLSARSPLGGVRRWASGLACSPLSGRATGSGTALPQAAASGRQAVPVLLSTHLTLTLTLTLTQAAAT